MRGASIAEGDLLGISVRTCDSSGLPEAVNSNFNHDTAQVLLSNCSSKGSRSRTPTTRTVYSLDE